MILVKKIQLKIDKKLFLFELVTSNTSKANIKYKNILE